MADGVDKHLPLPYRILSLYKIIELKFKSNGRWKEGALKNFLQPNAENFKKKDFTKNSKNTIRSIRD